MLKCCFVVGFIDLSNFFVVVCFGGVFFGGFFFFIFERRYVVVWFFFVIVFGYISFSIEFGEIDVIEVVVSVICEIIS